MKKETRPIISIEPSPADKVVEVLSWMVLAALWFLTIYNYQELPETIAVHFNVAGNPDRFDDKSTLFELPVIASVLFIVLTILCRFPQAFNYPVAITIANAAQQYRNGIRVIRGLKLSLAVVFLIINYNVHGIAMGQAESLGSWFLASILVIIFIPTLFVLPGLFKKRNG